jgi:serine O-acetyltransferase
MEDISACLSLFSPRRHRPSVMSDDRAFPSGGAEHDRPVIRSLAELRDYVREDYAVSDGFWTPGFQAVATYRLGVWCHGGGARLLKAPIRMLYRLLNLRMRNVHGIELSAQTRIGRRFRIAHQHGIVIHRRAVIGDDCLVRHGVTIGAVGGRRSDRGGPGKDGAPRLGDRVAIGAGAVLAGPIRIGDDVLVGPNAVVMTHVPPGAIVSSPQSRIMAPPPRREGKRN